MCVFWEYQAWYNGPQTGHTVHKAFSKTKSLRIDWPSDERSIQNISVYCLIICLPVFLMLLWLNTYRPRQGHMLCKLWWFRLDKSSRQCSQVEFQECAPISELLILCKDYGFRWTFRSPNHGANFFDFSCEGGCIEPGMVRQAAK